MTNEVLQQLYDRKSVRVFLDKEIGAEEKEAILKAAAQAPTGGNQQRYAIIDVTDEKLKEALVDTCDHQPMIAQAKMVLIFCADAKKWRDGFESVGACPRETGLGDLFLALSDAFVAAQNTVVAAQSLGIGSCYVGDIIENCETQRKLLNLPELVVPVAMLVFGYPTEQQERREKPERVDMKYIVHENGYHEMSTDELREMWSYKAGNNSYEDWMKHFCERKYNSVFAQEILRSFKEYAKQFDKTI